MKKMSRVLGWMVLTAAAAGVAAAQGGAATAAAASQTASQLVILDTDIGDDIDDAFALALVLKSPELDLMGVTTAYGDTELRAKLVDRFLAESICSFDRLLPVVPGLPTPHENVFTQAAYADGMAHHFDVDSCLAPGNLEGLTKGVPLWQSERKNHDAAGFLLRKIRERQPGEITLIAIGPLFNVQEAIKRDPATFRMLKRVVMMGGSVYRGYDGEKGVRRPPDAEWNISRDPAGLKALLDSGVPVFMMPLDSTQVHLEPSERERIFSHGAPVTDQLTLLYHQWAAGNENHSPTPTLFDPVAVAYAFRPDLCPAKPMHLEVDEKGFTRPTTGEPNAQVCLESDEKGFLKLLEDRLTAGPGR